MRIDLKTQQAYEEKVRAEARRERIEELLPGDFYRLHPRAQEAYWRQAEAQERHAFHFAVARCGTL